MRLAVFIFWIQILTISSYGQSSIEGRISSNQIPIEGAVVSFPKLNYQGITGKKGVFAIPVPSPLLSNSVVVKVHVPHDPDYILFLETVRVRNERKRSVVQEIELKKASKRKVQFFITIRKTGAGVDLYTGPIDYILDSPKRKYVNDGFLILDIPEDYYEFESFNIIIPRSRDIPIRPFAKQLPINSGDNYYEVELSYLSGDFDYDELEAEFHREFNKLLYNIEDTTKDLSTKNQELLRSCTQLRNLVAFIEHLPQLSKQKGIRRSEFLNSKNYRHNRNVLCSEINCTLSSQYYLKSIGTTISKLNDLKRQFDESVELEPLISDFIKYSELLVETSETIDQCFQGSETESYGAKSIKTLSEILIDFLGKANETSNFNDLESLEQVIFDIQSFHDFLLKKLDNHD